VDLGDELLSATPVSLSYHSSHGPAMVSAEPSLAVKYHGLFSARRVPCGESGKSSLTGRHFQKANS
jgi:hypothetical protein